MVKKLSVGLIVVGLSTALSIGQISPSKGGYLFRTKYVKGQNFKYLMKTSTKMQGNALKLEAPMTIKVINVSNNIADLASTFGPATMGGQQIPASKAQMKVDERGRAISGGANGLSATFPEKPVKVGETWVGEFNMAKAGAAGEAKASYTFKGLKAQGKGQVAVIAVTINTAGKTSQGGMVSRGAGTMLLNSADGQLVSLNMDMTITMGGSSGQKPMVLPTSISLVRQ